jgi:hypothetical protein
VAALNESPAVLERAKSLGELGAAQRCAGRQPIAREHLAEALDLAARCGARPLASRIREELTSAGARPRREQRRGAESLTPAELRVARLAAEAKTNGLQQATSKRPGTSSRNAAKTAARGARASRPAPTPRSPAGAHRADPALGSHRQLHTVRAGIAPPAQRAHTAGPRR